MGRCEVRPVTCVLCGGMVDDAETVEMPNGPMCADPCYKWIEKMIEEAEEDPETTIEFYEFDSEDDDDDDE